MIATTYGPICFLKKPLASFLSGSGYVLASISKFSVLFELFCACPLFPSLYFQLMIQNPTAVLMNHATSVNLNDLENARRLSIFTLAICANSKI